jgi:GcrA cell cycle regulator
MINNPTDWSEREIGRLRDLWQRGLSTAQIGQLLNRSKNSIIGRAHRMLLAARPSPIKRRDGAVTERVQLRAASAAAEAIGEATAPTHRFERVIVWSGARDAVLYDGWPAGVLARDLLKEINALPGPVVPMERLAIRASRLGLKRPLGYPQNAGTRRSVSIQEDQSIRKVASDAVQRVGQPTPILNGNDACSWPIGTPRTPGFRYCNEPPIRGKPYCPTHCERAYLVLSSDRRPRVIVAGGLRVTV